MKKIPLHLKILFALIAGAIFGIIFSVDQHSIEIDYGIGNKYYSVQVSNWQSLLLITTDTSEFSDSDQLLIIKKFKKAKKNNSNISIKIINGGNNEKLFNNIRSVSKIQTPATIIKPIGDLFIRLLSFLAIPLVIASLIAGAASIKDVKKLGRIGVKTFLLYIVTTTIAISIGLVLANTIKPGLKIPENSKNRLESVYTDDADISEDLNIDFFDFVLDIVPKNPFQAISNGNMLQIVFFAVLLGITLTFIDPKKSQTVVDFFSGLSETMIKMVDFIMIIAPYGVFALIAATVADFGIDILSTLIWYILTVIFGLFLHTAFIYGGIVKFIGRFNLRRFFNQIRNAQAIGFSTSSSAATLPVTFDCVEKMGVNKQISGFVLPLGATINMDGTALYQGVAAVFIAQVFGIDLDLADQIKIVFIAVLASIGTAPVPGVGIIMLITILNSVNIPAVGIALILGVDRILDMCRTITNVTGDAAVTVAIQGSENKFEVKS